MRQLVRDRNTRLLLAGQACSLFGDRAMYIVLGVWVKSLTGSNAAAGSVFFVLAAPGLVAPAFGLAVDRLRKRPLMIATNVAVGLALLSLLLVHDRGDVWLVYAVTLVYGAAGYLFLSAQSAYLTRLLPAERLGDANAALETLSQGMRLGAPLVGAALFALVGGAAVAVVDAATFAVSAACLAAIDLREEPPAAPEHHLLAQLAGGAGHIARSRGLRRIVVTTAVAMVVVGFVETAIFAVLQSGLHRPPAFLGVLSSVQGVGAIVGGVTAARLLRRIGDGRTLGLGILLFALGDALFLIPRIAPVLAGFAIAGAGLSWAVVALGTAVQVRMPAHLQGRVYSAADTLIGTPQTVSIAAGAALITVTGYRALVVLVAAVTCACGAYLTATGAPADGATI